MYDSNGFTGTQIGGFGLTGAGGSLTGNVTVINAANNPTLAITQDTGPLATPFTVNFSGLNTGATNDALTLVLGTNGAAAATTFNIHSALTAGATATGAITANAYEAVTINSLGSTSPTAGNIVTFNDAPSAGAATLTVTGNSLLALNDPNSFFTSVTSTDTAAVNLFHFTTSAGVAIGNVTATSNLGVAFTGGAGNLTAAGSTATGTEVTAVGFSSTGGAATPYNVADSVSLTVVNGAGTTGDTYKATVSVKAASDGDLAAAFAAAIANTPTTPTTFSDAADGSTVTVVTTAIGAGTLPAGLAAGTNSSGAHLVLSANNGVYYQTGVLATAGNTGTGTVAQTINSGAEEQLIVIAAATAGETYTANLTATTPGVRQP